MVASRDTALTLAERIERQHHEPQPRQINAEGLKIRARLGIRPPVAVIEKDGGRRLFQVFWHIQVRGHRSLGQRLVDDFFNVVTASVNGANDLCFEIGRPRQSPKA